MAKAPAPGDWTAIRLAQMREAGAKFGDFPDGDANGKRVPQMDAEYARELLKYWYSTAAVVREHEFERLPSESRERLGKAIDAFKAAMQPFAATVLTESPAPGQSFMLSKAAVLKFFDAVGQLARALMASAVSPSSDDLWWASVAEAARDVKNKVVEVVETGVAWGAIVAVAAAAYLLSRDRGRDKRG